MLTHQHSMISGQHWLLVDTHVAAEEAMTIRFALVRLALFIRLGFGQKGAREARGVWRLADEKATASECSQRAGCFVVRAVYLWRNFFISYFFFKLQGKIFRKYNFTLGLSVIGNLNLINA